MINSIKSIFILVVAFISISAQSKEESLLYLKSNLEFIASDELEGREATSHGEQIASLFIAKELKKYGIKPFGDDDTYFQNFNMAVGSVSPSSVISLTDNSGELTGFEFKDDFLFAGAPFYPDNSFSGKEYEMIFAGYGVISEKEDYNDYANLDVTGKVVVVLNGTPLESLDNMGYRAMRNFKSNIADSLGAAGMIIVTEEKLYGYWGMIQKYMSGKSYALENEVNEKKSIPFIYFSKDALTNLLEKEKYNYEELNEFINKKEKPESFTLNQKIKLEFETVYEIKNARNVIGVLEGNNENLRDEFVTVGGHYDHEGIRNGVVYYGADDNGSGTVAVLETARLLAERKENQRSILFFFYAAEEKGLLGSKYLANHVDYINDVVANINMDMIGREGENHLHNIGSGRLSTEFYNLIKEANDKSVKLDFDYKYDAPNDPNNFYRRSDHYHFALKGIPVVFFFDDMKEDYSKPTDTVDKINFNKVYKVTKLVEEIALKVANLGHRLKVDKLVVK